MKNLGSEYAISEPTVRQIVTGFTWTHVGGPLAPVEAPRGPLTPEETVEIRRAYAAQEKGVQALMQEYGIGFPRLKEVIADLPVWRPRQPPPPPMGGEQHPMAKLTWEKVREMRRLWAEKVPQQEIADRFGISLGQAHNILRGRSWKEPSNAA